MSGISFFVFILCKRRALLRSLSLINVMIKYLFALDFTAVKAGGPCICFSYCFRFQSHKNRISKLSNRMKRLRLMEEVFYCAVCGLFFEFLSRARQCKCHYSEWWSSPSLHAIVADIHTQGREREREIARREIIIITHGILFVSFGTCGDHCCEDLNALNSSYVFDSPDKCVKDAQSHMRTVEFVKKVRKLRIVCLALDHELVCGTSVRRHENVRRSVCIHHTGWHEPRENHK